MIKEKVSDLISEQARKIEDGEVLSDQQIHWFNRT